MTGMRTARRLLVIAALAATNACGNVVRNSRAPVILVIDTLQAAQGNHPSQFGGNLTSDVLTLVTTPAPCSTTSPCATIFNDVGQVVMHLTPKDIGVPAFVLSPSLNNQVTITRFRVDYRRPDGRNTPGVDVPYGFDGAVTGTVPANGQLTLGFEIVRHTAKEESPLLQLRNNGVIISTIATVTFYGTDLVGNAISATGSITIDFGNFGDT
jgi:hypothetical protein